LLIALMFSDSPELATRRVEEFLDRLDAPWELRDLFQPLAASPLASKASLLLRALPRLRKDELYYWSRGFNLLSRTDQITVATLLINDVGCFERAKWGPGLFDTEPLLESLARIGQEQPLFRKAIEQAIRDNKSNRRRQFAIHLFSLIADDAAATMMLELTESDLSLRGATAEFLHRARWWPREGSPRFPDYNSPRALPGTRALLLRLAHQSGTEIQTWARDQLHRLSAALEQGPPPNEARHPDLASGLSWPALSDSTSAWSQPRPPSTAR
jgi:hypothetical protein